MEDVEDELADNEDNEDDEGMEESETGMGMEDSEMGMDDTEEDREMMRKFKWIPLIVKKGDSVITEVDGEIALKKGDELNAK